MCGSKKLGYFIGNLIYVIERLASCCAVTAVVTCLMTTLILMLAFGIGLGYNYCFVDFKTKHEIPDTKSHTTTMGTPFPMSSEEVLHTYTHEIKATSNKEFAIPPVVRRHSSLLKRKSIEHAKETSLSPVPIKRTIIVPLDGVDFPSLLSKIRALKKNVTLQIITS